ncbi:hypothetical protein ABMY35_01220 [Pseudoalteromonas sp. BZB3]
MKNIKASKLKEKELGANYASLVSGGACGFCGGVKNPDEPKRPPKEK